MDENVGETIHSFHFLNFPETKVAEQAKQNLNETPEKVIKGIEAMKHFIAKKNLRGWEDEDFLLKFLRVKKFRHSDSCKMLEGFIKSIETARIKLGPMEKDVMKRVLDKNITVILPNRDSDGRPILCYRNGIMPNAGVTAKESMNAFELAIFALVQDPTAQTVGFDYILDCKNATFSEVYQHLDIWIMFVRLLAKLPIRIHRVDVISDAFIFKLLWATYKSLMPRKTRDRVFFHGNSFEPLVTHYGRSIVPDIYGGTSGPISNNHWMDKVDGFIDKFTRMQMEASK